MPVNAVLAGLGRHTHKSQREQLFKEIQRLAMGSLQITEKGTQARIIHLIDEASTPLDQAELPRCERNLSYRINPKVQNFLSQRFYTLYDQRERLKLGRNSLARWLQLWVISHAEQYPHKVETIWQRCGSRMKDLKEFRKQLRSALDVLKENGVITAWAIDPKTDLVHIGRTPSPAQQEYLAKKAAAKAAVAGRQGGKAYRRNEPTQIGDLFADLLSSQ